MKNHSQPSSDNDIPLTPTGIPSPYPYLNDVDDEEGLDDGGGSARVVLDPDEPDDLGGEGADYDEEDEDDMDDPDMGFGIGLLSMFSSTPQFA